MKKVFCLCMVVSLGFCAFTEAKNNDKTNKEAEFELVDKPETITNEILKKLNQNSSKVRKTQ